MSGSSAPAPTTSAGLARRRAASASSETASSSTAARANDAARRGPLVGIDRRPPPSRPSARSRAPARVPSPPRGRRGRSRRARPGRAPAGRPRPGSRPPGPCSLPARNGSVARWRRSCWPTTTTSGARLTRAVASALTALPSPAVVCRIASAGSPRPIAQPVAMPTTELSCSASTKRRSSGQVGQAARSRSTRDSRRASSARTRGRRRTSHRGPSGQPRPHSLYTNHLTFCSSGL